ncbi:hypothetical protein [Salibacterium halotolerans]
MMGSCPIDHSLDDVKQKLEDQKDVMPAALYHDTARFFHDEQPQSILNEGFHLLKKYDLAGQEEKENRNAALQQLLQRGE